MNEILTIKNVRGFIDDNGVAQLNAEDIARGFGFTEVKDTKEYVKWRRINEYLQEFGFSPQVAKDDFIPENMVYRLGFKASNETAQKFQAILADEILPAIRKHGMYATDNVIEQVLQNPDFGIKLLVELKDEREQRRKLELQNAQKEQIINELKPKADYTDFVLKNKSLVTTTQIAKDYGMSGKEMNKRLNNLKVQYKQSGQWLLYSKYQKNGYTHSETIDIEHKDGRKDVTMHTKWTQKGRLFIYDLMKNQGILPLIERNLELR